MRPIWAASGALGSVSSAIHMPSRSASSNGRAASVTLPAAASPSMLGVGRSDTTRIRAPASSKVAMRRSASSPPPTTRQRRPSSLIPKGSTSDLIFRGSSDEGYHFESQKLENALGRAHPLHEEASERAEESVARRGGSGPRRPIHPQLDLLEDLGAQGVHVDPRSEVDRSADRHLLAGGDEEAAHLRAASQDALQRSGPAGAVTVRSRDLEPIRLVPHVPGDLARLHGGRDGRSAATPVQCAGEDDRGRQAAAQLAPYLVVRHVAERERDEEVWLAIAPLERGGAWSRRLVGARRSRKGDQA